VCIVLVILRVILAIFVDITVKTSDKIFSPDLILNLNLVFVVG